LNNKQHSCRLPIISHRRATRTVPSSSSSPIVHATIATMLSRTSCLPARHNELVVRRARILSAAPATSRCAVVRCRAAAEPATSAPAAAALYTELDEACLQYKKAAPSQVRIHASVVGITGGRRRPNATPQPATPLSKRTPPKANTKTPPPAEAGFLRRRQGQLRGAQGRGHTLKVGRRQRDAAGAAQRDARGAAPGALVGLPLLVGLPPFVGLPLLVGLPLVVVIIDRLCTRCACVHALAVCNATPPTPT
jgi:hypothetical protein